MIFLGFKHSFLTLFLEAKEKNGRPEQGLCIPKSPGLKAIFLPAFPVSQWPFAGTALRRGKIFLITVTG